MPILKPLTNKAQDWMEQNIQCEDYQLLTEGIIGDWRMIQDIQEAMILDGLKLVRKWWQFWIKIDFKII